MDLWAWASAMPVKRHQELTPWRHEEWAPVFVEGCGADPLNCLCEEAQPTRQYPHAVIARSEADAAIQGFTAAPGHAAHPPWVATGLSALAMTGNGTSLRGGAADAAIQGFTAAPGHAAHLPWFATGLRPSR
jgi:hypothetical protein